MLEDFIRSAGDGELIGRSRLESARQVEREKCAQVAEDYKKQISTWTAADDHSPALASQHTAVCAALDEVARRIRKRSDVPRKR